MKTRKDLEKLVDAKKQLYPYKMTSVQDSVIITSDACYGMFDTVYDEVEKKVIKALDEMHPSYRLVIASTRRTILCGDAFPNILAKLSQLPPLFVGESYVVEGFEGVSEFTITKVII